MGSVQQTRGTTGGQPRETDRGVVADETALDRWSRKRGYAMDFRASDATPRVVADDTALSRWSRERGYAMDFRSREPTPRRETPAARDARAPKSKNERKPTPDARPEPEAIVQQGQFDCWAAALVSWSKAAGAEKIASYREFKNTHPLELQRGLDEERLMTLLQKDYKMKLYKFSRKELTAARLAELTDLYGPLFVGSARPEGLNTYWHAMVVFDVFDRPPTLFRLMDPAMQHASRAIVERSLAWIFSPDPRRRAKPDQEILVGFNPAWRRIQNQKRANQTP